MPDKWSASLLGQLRSPRYRWLRIPAGLALITGGLFGFLPIVGFWMLPLGLSILALDLPIAGRALRRLKAIMRLIGMRLRKMRRGTSCSRQSRPPPIERRDERK